MTHYAQFETKSAPVGSDFARDFMTRRWGAEFTAALLERLPRYQRGPRKGEIKGRLFWTKCTKGGWRRTGPSYHGSPNGHVVTPGASDLRVGLGYDCPSETGISPDYWPSSYTPAQLVERLERTIAEMVEKDKRARRGW